MIAVDAMGGDRAPQAPVIGALRAARQGIPVKLYGDKARITQILNRAQRAWSSLPISIHNCTQTVTMTDEPYKSVRKKDSSLIKAVQAVKDGEADIIVSAGNSGAMLVAGTILFGRVAGLKRPAIGQFLPTKQGSIFCLDLGVNADCKPSYLKQFAIIGSTYVRLIKKIDNPRVALLSNGSEPYKGSALVKEAYDHLESAPINFVGNLEPCDMFDGHADVLVCDGFSGNVMLKSIEGAMRVMMHWIKGASKRNWIRRFLSLLFAPLLCVVKKRTDYARKGGALLLGVSKPMVLAHGSSNARSMLHAILFANKTVKNNFTATFNKELEVQLDKNIKGARSVAQKVRSIFRLKRP